MKDKTIFKNPLGKSNFVHTPASMKELEKTAETYSGSEKVAFLLGMTQAWNLASDIVEKKLEKFNP